jgi:hypothetical protein
MRLAMSAFLDAAHWSPRPIVPGAAATIGAVARLARLGTATVPETATAWPVALIER